MKRRKMLSGVLLIGMGPTVDTGNEEFTIWMYSQYELNGPERKSMLK
jgi:hypothetical protein